VTLLPGAYFFTGAFWERAPQDGAIGRRIRQIIEEWLTALRRAVDGARRRGEIRREVDAERTALELNSLLIGAQWSYLLADEDHSKARLAILAKTCWRIASLFITACETFSLAYGVQRHSDVDPSKRT
jgi:hypothetical protein